jgi:DNA-binding GntR family transcriptional regulator
MEHTRIMSAHYLNKTLPPSSKRTLGEEVADRLRQDILSGRLAPGALLRENSLADDMGVSRGPVREALSQLAREGLVILPRNHSAFVARLSEDDLEEVHSMRMALAPLAVRLAARNVTPSELNVMDNLVRELAERGPGLTGQEAAELDVRFHDSVYRASKHRLLCQCWSHMKPLVHMLMLSHAVSQPDFLQLTLASHRALVNALRAHDEAMADTLAREHAAAAYADVKRSYEGSA